MAQWGGSRRAFDPFNLDVGDPMDIPDYLLKPKLADGESFCDKNAVKPMTVVYIQVDWRETDTAHIFKSNLPGVKKEDVKVQVEEGRILQISGELQREELDKNDKWHRVERQYGAFNRRFRLPDNIQVEEVKGNMENGVLTVTVPKTVETKLKIKTIDISGN